MDIKIYDKNINYIGVIDSYISFIWKRSYMDVGGFELHILLNQNNLDLLRTDNLIIKDNEVAFIDYKEMYQDIERKEILVVHGQMATGYLARRIIWETITIKEIEQGIRKLITDNAINPNDSNRKIERLKLGQIQGFNQKIDKQITYKNLLDEIKSLSNTAEIGFSIVRSSNNELVFELFQGKDRTTNQSTNSYAIFSQEFDNVLEQEYTETKRNYKNTALIAGQGEGEQRTKETIGNNKGLDRYELFVDAKDLAKENLTDEEYKSVLRGRGFSKLFEYVENYTFNARVDTNSNLIYKQDYDLGDKVTIVNKKWGIKLDARITEITEIYEESGFRLEMTFGNGVISLTKKIKQEVDSWQ